MDDQARSAVTVFLAKVAVLLLLAGVVLLFLYCTFAAKRQVNLKEVITVLRSEDLTFLVTDRLVTQVVVESTEGSLLLGKREGYLIAPVRLYYGIDLKRLPPDAVSVKDGVIRVVLPEPQELDFSVDADAMKFICKRSGLIVLRDLLQGLDIQRELHCQLQTAAREMMRKEGMIPTRGDLVQRLNRYAIALKSRLGMEIVFQ